MLLKCRSKGSSLVAHLQCVIYGRQGYYTIYIHTLQQVYNTVGIDKTDHVVRYLSRVQYFAL